jgi:hypothetical protein
MESIMNKQQITNLLGASTISAVAVGLALMFGGGGNAQSATPAPSVENVMTEVVTADSYNALVEQNAQLQQAVETLKDRETQYQTQLTLAQEALDQQAIAAETSYAAGGEYDEEEEYEAEHDDEHEAHGAYYEEDDD